MSLSFFKMHGLGNDFVIIDGRNSGFLPDKNFCLKVADRHRGVGYDQLIVLHKPENPLVDLVLLIFNADGSRAGACGNATRCVARLLFEETGKKEGMIETVAGLLPVWLEKDGLFAVDFGAPRLGWEEIPLAREMDTFAVDLGLEGLPCACCVSMGNPHAVFFVPDSDAVSLEEIGPKIERHGLFPERTNAEFAHIIDDGNIRMRVFERGTGITQACGSGALATLVAAVRLGLCGRQATIHLDGGTLSVNWRERDGHVILRGPASLSFQGVISEDL